MKHYLFISGNNLVLLFLVLLCVSATGQQQELTSEIKRVRKELKQVQQEREQIKDEFKKDMEYFKEYRSRYNEKFRRIKSQTDSFKVEVNVYKEKKDSLSALINSVKARTKNYQLRQDGFRQEMIKGCNTLLSYTDSLPPTVTQKSKSALNLLKNELETKNVDNIESVNRLFQIVKDMEDATSSIQIVQGSSPTGEIRGTVYRLRIGTIFEGVVNSNGTRAVLWTGYDENGQPEWKVIEDPVLASEILKAVNVREGKELPELVRLPFENVEVVKENSVK